MAESSFFTETNMAKLDAATTGFNMFASGMATQASAAGQAADAASNAKIAGLNLEKSNRNYMAQMREVATNKAINLDTNYATYIYGGLTMSGTPQMIQDKTAATYNADISMLKANMKTDAAIYKTQQKSFYAQQAAAKKSGMFGKISSVIGGAVTGSSFGGPAGAFVGAGVGMFA